ncbi:MAG: hypothetical protein M3044_03025 [Thermoproteota archaeon]|nr:hypothetical protein [Thermoproteota archaeon]
MQDALNMMEYARSLKRLNVELYEHLYGSILYIVKYAEKNKITLPQRENLLELITKTDNYIHMIKEKKMPYTEFDSKCSSDDG